ncbi:MAG: hypothetical protein CVV22_11960 [Ignavibacteriae bacterium HGW-Ignavibacteriae-1]|jgi:hypothetical protein|nr:MAG: hypothetical protein CVV22_11960 [Ignavibacteriae bacterium HGW-Ignavibacteriae-1]
MKKILLLSILTILISCSSAQKSTECLSDKDKDFKIHWGKIIKGDMKGNNYTLTSDRKIHKGATQSNTVEGDLIATIEDAEAFCSFYSDLMNVMLRIQSLHVPADTNHFIEFINPGMNYKFRAMWNPNHDNQGNREFKAIYKRLEEFISVNQSTN